MDQVACASQSLRHELLSGLLWLLELWTCVSSPGPDILGTSATHVQAPISCSPFLEYPTCLRRGELAQVGSGTLSALSQEISAACP